MISFFSGDSIRFHVFVLDKIQLHFINLVTNIELIISLICIPEIGSRFERLLLSCVLRLVMPIEIIRINSELKRTPAFRSIIEFIWQKVVHKMGMCPDEDSTFDHLYKKIASMCSSRPSSFVLPDVFTFKPHLTVFNFSILVHYADSKNSIVRSAEKNQAYVLCDHLNYRESYAQLFILDLCTCNPAFYPLALPTWSLTTTMITRVWI